jgi:hypothetical protein
MCSPVGPIQSHLEFGVDETVVDLLAAVGKVEQLVHPHARVQVLGGGHLAHPLELHPVQDPLLVTNRTRKQLKSLNK